MKKRVFVAINLPENLKLAIQKELENIKTFFGGDLLARIRFAPPDNWHLTISFLGYQDEPSLRLIQSATKRAAGNFPPPVIDFQRLAYGPRDNAKSSTARMIWLVCSARTSKMLAKLKEEMENSLAASGIKFKKEDKNFLAHLTLARFDPVSRTKLPDIERILNWSFAAMNLDLMESHLRRSGAEYEIRASFGLGEK